MKNIILKFVFIALSSVYPIFGHNQEAPKPQPKSLYLHFSFRAPKEYQRGDYDSFPCDQFMRDRVVTPSGIRLSDDIPDDWERREDTLTIRDFFGPHVGKTACDRHSFIYAIIPIPYPYSFGMKPQERNLSGRIIHGEFERISSIGYGLSSWFARDAPIDEKDEEPVFTEEIISPRKIKFEVKNMLNGGSGLISIDGGITYYNLEGAGSKDSQSYIVDVDAVAYRQSVRVLDPPVSHPLPKVPTPAKVLLMGARGWRVFTKIYTWGKGWEINPQTIKEVKKVKKRVPITTVIPGFGTSTGFEEIWVEE